MPQNNVTSNPEVSAYRDRLNTWAIARLLPDLEQTVVARFRSRSNAEGHLKRLKQLSPQASFVLVFDRQSETHE
ncbi:MULTISPECIES: hypothetical protein [Lyngbya]|jgi:hypothetical protein|uniref:Uncharacterized protein n=1 Tax=Lyngbya aestuarii BL J TaxID=1348334 RepID=U7QR07_9CYAN|nr:MULTISPECIES: hypothetical protein [Lyngbya]EAW37542.1 hypothetical protein L8106_00905 [Lyngbya sp. PCC 8106]ERT09535.1 hypothetical protein M595_0572 [Lyngbya aestuarii BL J]